MAVITTEYLDRSLRDILHATDVITKLTLLSALTAVCVAASSDMTNIQNAFTTEIARRKALTVPLRSNGS